MLIGRFFSILSIYLNFVSCIMLGSAPKPQKPLNPFQQELKQRLAQRMQAMQKKLEKMPEPTISKPTEPKKVSPSIVQREIKEREAQTTEQLKNAFWGTAQNVKKLWNEQQKLLVDRKAGSWDEPNWKAKEYNRLGEIRDSDAPKMNPSLARFLPDYIVLYGELSGGSRDILLKIADTLASALFGNAPLQPTAENVIKQLVRDLRQVSPKTKALADLMEKIIERKIKAPAPSPAKNGKHEAELKQQKNEQCLEDLRKFYRDDLEKQRRDLMEIFYDITGMNEQQFLKYVADNRDRIIAEIKALPAYKGEKLMKKSSRFYPFIYKLLEKNNLKNIPIFDTEEHTLAAGPLGIYIDTQFYSHFTDFTIEVSVLHEIQHILFDDLVVRLSMADILRHSPSKESFLQLWNFFKEKRADILAWLTSPEHVKSDVEFYGSVNPATRYAEGPRHISNANREAMAQELYQQMMACLQK